MDSRNIFNNPNPNATASSGGGNSAVNMVTTNTPQTITSNKVYTANQTYQSHLMGSEISNLYIHDIYLRGESPMIFSNDIQIDSSILRNDSELVKTSGNFTLNGNLILADVSVTGNITASDTSELSVNHLKLKGDSPSISILDGDNYRPLDSTHLLDYSQIVRTNTNQTLSGQIDFTQNPTVNDKTILTTDNVATLQISDETTHAPVGAVIQSGQNLFTEASPSPLCVTDSLARIDSYYLYNDKFLPYIMGYHDLAKPDTYAHGLVPAGSSDHMNQFLRKDGVFAQMSEIYSGTVSQTITDLRGFPSNFTGSNGKYLRCSFGAQHPDGAGLEFSELSSDVVPIITETLSNNTLSSIKCNGTMEAQQLLITSDERMKKDIENFDDGIEVIKQIQTKTYKYINSDKTNVGILAQDLLQNEVLKESVHKTDSGFLKVNYVDLIGILLNSVKQLIVKVESIEGLKK